MCKFICVEIIKSKHLMFFDKWLHYDQHLPVKHKTNNNDDILKIIEGVIDHHNEVHVDDIQISSEL